MINSINPDREKLYEDENGYVLASFVQEKQTVFIHLHFNPGAWSVSKYKHYKELFPTLLNKIKEGRQYVYATPYETDVKAQKLIKMFEFKECGRWCGLVLMRREV